jgi:hypothetical protein
MKSILYALTLISSFSIFVFSQQSGNPNENSDQTAREFVLDSIRVDGEVESPLSVSLRQLPLRSVSIKELELDSTGRQKFKGAFSYSGYSLYDILSSVTVAKKNQKEFAPYVDLYVIVANEKGEQAVFSWGEIFYASDNFRFLISKSVRSINPSKLKARWTLPSTPRLICAGDLSNIRFIDNPSKIAVRSYGGIVPTGSKETMYSPTVALVSDKETSTLEETATSIQPRKFTFVGYGHGMGYKGVSTIEGYPLKEVLEGKLVRRNEDMRTAVVVVSSKDGYRSVFSASEIWNRNNSEDILLIDRKGSQSDGRYTLFVPSDFFVDRNVRAVERIQIVNARSDSPGL